MSKHIETISLESDEDEVDPLRLTPPVQVVPRSATGTKEIAVGHTLGSKPRDSVRILTINEKTTKRLAPVRLAEPHTELFETLTDKCFECDPTPETRTILTKTRRHYEKTNPAYLASASFIKLLNDKIAAIMRSPLDMYTHLLEVHTEMKARRFRNHTNIRPLNGEEQSTSRGITNQQEIILDSDPEEDDYEPAVRAKLKKYNKCLKKLRKMISRIEEKEVDWDDDCDSSYIQLQRYRDRFCSVYNAVCKLTGEKPSRNKPKIVCNTQFPNISNCIEKYVNSTGNFPDFHDIYTLAVTCNKDEGLDLSAAQLTSLSQKAFEQVGEQLQRHRQIQDWNVHSAFLGENHDPADFDPELSAKLTENRVIGKTKLEELIVSFVKKEEDQKMDPDKEAEEDPDCSDGDSKTDEEVNGDEECDILIAGSPNNGNDSLDNTLLEESSSSSSPNRPVVSIDDSPTLDAETGLVEYLGLGIVQESLAATSTLPVADIVIVTSSQGNGTEKFDMDCINIIDDETPTQSETISSIVDSPVLLFSELNTISTNSSSDSTKLPSETNNRPLKRKLEPIIDPSFENKLTKLITKVNETIDSLHSDRKVIVTESDMIIESEVSIVKTNSSVVSGNNGETKNPLVDTKSDGNVNIKDVTVKIPSVPSEKKTFDLVLDIPIGVVQARSQSNKTSGSIDVSLVENETIVMTSSVSAVKIESEASHKSIRVRSFGSTSFSKSSNVLIEHCVVDDDDIITIDD